MSSDRDQLAALLADHFPEFISGSCLCGAEKPTLADWSAHAAEVLLAKGVRPPAQVIDAVELDALPRGTAVLTRNGRVWQKAVTPSTEWWPALAGWDRPANSGLLLGMGVVTILHIPSEDWLRFVPIEEVPTE